MNAAAFTGEQTADQTNGPSAQAQGSRFKDWGDRSPDKSSAYFTGVGEALAAAKAGTFTVENLRQLAHGMGFQIIEGKETADLALKIADQAQQIMVLTHRAEMAEAAVRAQNEQK